MHMHILDIYVHTTHYSFLVLKKKKSSFLDK